MKSHKVGGDVEFRQFANESEEAQHVAAELAGSISSGCRMADHAVLVRSGYRANALVEALKGRGIPVSDWRGDKHTPNDRRLMSACLAVLRGKLYPRQVQRLLGIMRLDEVEPEETGTEDFLRTYEHEPLAKGLLEVRQLAFRGGSPHSIAKAAQEACRAQDRVLGMSLDDLVESVAQFELYDSDFSLEHLLSELALGSIGRAPTEGGGVKVASLHRTKGLQWRKVFLLGLEDGHSPDYRAGPDELSEERRLCFVGVSRAQDRLVITQARSVKGWNKKPSCFLSEMQVVRQP